MRCYVYIYIASQRTDPWADKSGVSVKFYKCRGTTFGAEVTINTWAHLITCESIATGNQFELIFRNARVRRKRCSRCPTTSQTVTVANFAEAARDFEPYRTAKAFTFHVHETLQFFTCAQVAQQSQRGNRRFSNVAFIQSLFIVAKRSVM